MNDAQMILEYHEATKHHFHRYARSAGHMDWANQPNPFRSYEEVKPILLPLASDQKPEISYAQLHAPAGGLAQPLNLTTLGRFLGLSLGLSAWKASGGSRWSLRINPSSGNLHPTEGYLLLPPFGELSGGAYHYNVFHHALESRLALPEQAWPAWETHFQGPGFFVALSSIFWRESWKYGERAYRYCNLDVGHALAALAYAARLNGWRLTCITGAGDDQIRALLGFNQTLWEPLEEEAPDLIGWVSLGTAPDLIPQTLPNELVAKAVGQPVIGRPNRLSQQPVDWSIIYRAEHAARKPPTPPLACDLPATHALVDPPPTPKAADIIRQRRSATAYDPRQSIIADAFQSILDRTRPHRGVPPFDVALMNPSVDLLIFVHRVLGVDVGLYFFKRSGRPLEEFKALFDRTFVWQAPLPALPLWLLRPGDVTIEAMETSCHQEIAGHGAFAVAMLAPLNELVSNAPYLYRHLHWECGQIGQVLYLEAEAQGLRGTGIGCFFDDAVTDLLGMEKNTLNSLYHFTIGHPLEDPRVQTLPAYHHLKR
jgi:SagB-type dehydrogenase family enzyme